MPQNGNSAELRLRLVICAAWNSAPYHKFADDCLLDKNSATNGSGQAHVERKLIFGWPPSRPATASRHRPVISQAIAALAGISIPR